MKHSEFYTALEQVFGSYGPSLAMDLVLDGLHERTAQEALADGVKPQLVWDAIRRTTQAPGAERYPHRTGHRRGSPE